MSRYFEELERDLVRAAAKRARPARGLAALTAVLTLGVAGTAAAGTYFALRSSSIAPFAATDTTPEQRVTPGTSRLPALRAADPDPGAPPWTVRVSRSAAGLQCSTVGQVQDGAFGLVGLDGAFRTLPEANADACGEPGTLFGTRVFDADRPRDVRTVVNGVAGPGVERVTVALADRRPRTVPHSSEGAFALVLRGRPEQLQPLVAVQMHDGVTREYPFAGAASTLVPDPDGGRAWRPTTAGPYKRRAANPTYCSLFMAAEPPAQREPASSTRVCGVDHGTRQELYFDTRRLRGDGPSESIALGDWNNHSSRTAVWGVARGHERLIVRAGRFEKAIQPFGAFVVFLPSETDPRAVSVEVDGTRYGRSHGTVPDPRRPR